VVATKITEEYNVDFDQAHADLIKLLEEMALQGLAAKDEAEAHGWQCGEEHIVADKVREVFAKQRKLSSIEGVRQRDFLNELNRLASLASAS
jgi:ligand-binding sensor domain-containing protein